jgi:branched-chain amino acid transport system substrate-binding protein
VMTRTRTALVAAAAITVVTTAACTRDTASKATAPNAQAQDCPAGLKLGPASGPAIHIGNVSSLTGPGTFPESSKAAKAVFDRLNRCGGVKGRPVAFHVEDDQGDPGVAAQAARRLVQQQGVVALAGSASLLDCAVNSAYYAAQQVDSVQGTGVDPVCFNSPNIAPVNTGPFTGVTVSLYYASEQLKKDKVCRIRLFDIPGFAPAFDAAVTRWEIIAKKKLAYSGKIGKPTDDATPLLLKAKQAGCQAVVVDGLESHAIAVAKAVKAHNLADITWIGLTSYYTDNVAKQLGATGNGLQANSEFEPYNSDSPALADVRGLLRDANVPLTSFAEGGYLAASIVQAVLLSIDAEVTRASVSDALDKLTAFESPLLGSPFRFGPGNAHAPNQSSKFVVLDNGVWKPTDGNWVSLPAT